MEEPDEDRKKKKERKLEVKTSSLNPEYEDVKNSLLKFVGSKKHFFFMERSLSDFFCSENYCKSGEDIFEKNNIEKPKDMSQDIFTLREACMKRCSKVAKDEAKYQKITVLGMNNNVAKRRILRIFHIVYNTPHYCLNL